MKVSKGKSSERSVGRRNTLGSLNAEALRANAETAPVAGKKSKSPVGRGSPAFERSHRHRGALVGEMGDSFYGSEMESVASTPSAGSRRKTRGSLAGTARTRRTSAQGSNGGIRRAYAQRRPTSRANNYEEIEDNSAAEEAAWIQKQLAFVMRFRQRLLETLISASASAASPAGIAAGEGDEEAVLSELMKHSSEGALSFGAFMGLTEQHRLWRKKTSKEEEVLDVRKVFNVLDVQGTGYVSCFELACSTEAEFTEKLQKSIIRTRFAMEQQANPPAAVCPMNLVERFRRFLLTQWGTLEVAFQELVTMSAGKVISAGEVEAGLSILKMIPKDELGRIDIFKAFEAMTLESTGAVSLADLQGLWPPMPKSAARTKGRRGKLGKQGKGSKDDEDDEDEGKDKKAKRRVLEMIGQLLDGRGPGDSVWMQQIEDFAHNAHQLTLDLRHACIGDWGAERLAKAMPPPSKMGFRSLEVLILDGNYICDSGCIRLSLALERYCAVHKLSMARNGIGDLGAEALGSLVTRVFSLTHLGLAKNVISDAGASQLCEALSKKAKSTLKVLDLKANEISIAGVKMLRQIEKPPLKVELAGNVGNLSNQEVVDVSPFLGTLWGSDVALPIRAPPPDFVHRRRLNNNLSLVEGSEDEDDQASTSLLTNDTAAKLSCHEMARTWAPSQNLSKSLSFAKSLGMGMRGTQSLAAARHSKLSSSLPSLTPSRTGSESARVF